MCWFCCHCRCVCVCVRACECVCLSTNTWRTRVTNSRGLAKESGETQAIIKPIAFLLQRYLLNEWISLLSGMKVRPTDKDVILSLVWIAPVILPHTVILFKEFTSCVGSAVIVGVCVCVCVCVCTSTYMHMLALCKPALQTNNPGGKVVFFMTGCVTDPIIIILDPAGGRKKLERAESLVKKKKKFNCATLHVTRTSCCCQILNRLDRYST